MEEKIWYKGAMLVFWPKWQECSIHWKSIYYCVNIEAIYVQYAHALHIYDAVSSSEYFCRESCLIGRLCNRVLH